MPHVERFDLLAVVRIVQLGRTKAIKHSEGVATYFHNHLNPNLSQWKEGSHDSYLWLQVSRGVAPDLFVCVVYATPVDSKHKNKSLFMAEHPVMNQGSSLAWQMGGVALSIILLAHLQFGWQTVTHLEVIIDNTCYCAIKGDSDHRLLRLQLNIDYTFVEPQHI